MVPSHFFAETFPELTYLHRLDGPPQSSALPTARINSVFDVDTIIILDWQNDDIQTVLTSYQKWLSRPRGAGRPIDELTVVAGTQHGGFQTFIPVSSFFQRLVDLSREDLQGRSLQCTIIEGGPMEDPKKAPRYGLNPDRQEALSQAAADRLSRSLGESEYCLRAWTSLNTFSRLPKAKQKLCRGVVLTSPLTCAADGISLGWNLRADATAYRKTEEVCEELGIPLILLRGGLLSVQAEHQMAFDRGGYDRLLDPSIKIHPDDKATFDRTMDKVLGEDLTRLSGALSFLRGKDTMIRPEIEEGSTIADLIDGEAYRRGWDITPVSVILTKLTAGNNPYLDRMGDVFDCALGEEAVQYVPVRLVIDDDGTVEMRRLEEGEKAVTYLAVAPPSFEKTFMTKYRPPIDTYQALARSSDAPVSLVSEPRARKWLEYVSVAAPIAQECRHALDTYTGGQLRPDQISKAKAELDRVLRDFATGTMTCISRRITETA